MQKNNSYSKIYLFVFISSILFSPISILGLEELTSTEQLWKEYQTMKKEFEISLDDEQVRQDYLSTLAHVRERIRQEQYQALVTVNNKLVKMYREIGEIVYTKQQSAGWGNSTVEQFAKDLRESFPGIKGFSAQNIWHMRTFHLAYANNERLRTLSGEISWSNNIAILDKCKDPLEREFYIRMAKSKKWSYRVLINHISNKTYEKTLLNQTNFDQTLPESLKHEAKVSVKDEYVFDFLELDKEYTESELEKSIIAKIEHFLREMGGIFAFIGSQYRLEVGDQEFFIDLLLYHRRLKSLVAIELKIGKFIPEYVGKMQFYLAVLDDQVRMEGENPSIGIILCKEKNRTIVEYALKQSAKSIGVAAYQMVSELPKELQKELPSPEQISQLMEIID